MQPMQLMQYEITLPADYDMGIIRHRVATRGSGTDEFPGLGIKAYLVRERGRDGSPVNQYAPFYLWSGLVGHEPVPLRPGLRRHPHRLRAPLPCGPGTASRCATAPSTHRYRSPPPAPWRASTRAVRSRSSPAGSLDETAARSRQPGVNCTVVGVDPSTWLMVRLTLWAEGAPDEGRRVSGSASCTCRSRTVGTCPGLGQRRGLTRAELNSKVSELKEELFSLRFQSATGQLESHGRLREVRKDIARIYTVIQERTLGIVDDPDAAEDTSAEKVEA